MPTDAARSAWSIIENCSLVDETALVRRLVAEADLNARSREAIVAEGSELVRQIRAGSRPGLMEVFLAEYGLSTDEGIALWFMDDGYLDFKQSKATRNLRICWRILAMGLHPL